MDINRNLFGKGGVAWMTPQSREVDARSGYALYVLFLHT